MVWSHSSFIYHHIPDGKGVALQCQYQTPMPVPVTDASISLILATAKLCHRSHQESHDVCILFQYSQLRTCSCQQCTVLKGHQWRQPVTELEWSLCSEVSCSTEIHNQPRRHSQLRSVLSGWCVLCWGIPPGTLCLKTQQVSKQTQMTVRHLLNELFPRGTAENFCLACMV